MKRKFLEDMGLTKDQVDKILDENSQDIGKAKSELETLQTKIKTLETDNSALKTQITDRDKQLDTLKNSARDIDTLKQQIETLQADNKAKDDAHASEMKRLKVDNAITNALTTAKAVNLKAVKALLDLGEIDKIELLEDGSVKGLADKIKALQTAEDSKMLFKTDDQRQFKGAKFGEPGNDDGNQGLDTSKMSYEEIVSYLEQNPDAKI